MPEVKVIADFEKNLTAKQLKARFAKLLKMLNREPKEGYFLDYVVRPEGRITIEIEI